MSTFRTADGYDVTADAREFWQGIRDGADPSSLNAIRERLKEHCPSIDAFSFELVGDEALGTGTESSPRSENLSTVGPNTPSSCASAWNSAKLVSLCLLDSRDVCGAAIGTVRAGTLDFKACSQPYLSCEYGTHKAKNTIRMDMPLIADAFALRIGVPVSSGAVVQVFSRPYLCSTDLVHLPQGSKGFALLMSLAFEPRVWKLLLSAFPGPSILLRLDAPPQTKPAVETFATPRSYSPPPVKSESSADSLKEVTEAPISSPFAARGGLPPVATQRDGWSDGSLSDDDAAFANDNASVPSQRGSLSGPRRSNKAGLFPWDNIANDLQVQHSVASSNVSLSSSVPSTADKTLAKLLTRVKELEAREKARESSLGKLLVALNNANKDLGRDLRKAREEIARLNRAPPQAVVVPQSAPSQPAPVDLNHLATQLFRVIKEDGRFALRSDIPRVPNDLEGTLQSWENEFYHSAGLIPRLIARVELLEASRSATSIEMGGHVFSDEGAVEAFLKPLNDPNAHRFCADFLALLLLAEPKFETIQQGLDQTAAAMKAHFPSLDVATIDLSYKMVYPPRILKSSDKEAAQENGGVEWASGFASHVAFDGTYNNGTHFNLEKSLKGVIRAWEAGIDATFPVRTHPKPNAVFKAQLNVAGTQCLEYLGSLTPLFKQISGGGMSDKEAWSRGLVFSKQIFDDVALVRAINSEGTIASKVWASFKTTEMLKSYQMHNWVEHPKASSILALTSIRKEGKIVTDTIAKLRDQNSTIAKHSTDIKKLQEDIKALKQKNPSLA